MIQRIQSFYLSLITLLTLLFFRGGFLNFANKAGEVIKVTFTGIFRESAGNSLELIENLIPFSVLIVLIPVISLLTIFFFKNRKIQLRFSLFLIILAATLIIALIHVSFSIISKFEAKINPGFKMILPVLILILSILAYRGIKKDDQLVKSYDRLR
jgi:cytochrome bd-type quinol oxidase subunit 2